MNKKLNNFEMCIIIFLLYIFIINTNTNSVLCEESIITETVSNVETNSSYNYKKIFFYTIGIITVSLLLYYILENIDDTGDFYPEDEDFSIIADVVLIPKKTGWVLNPNREPLTIADRAWIESNTIPDYYRIQDLEKINNTFENLTNRVLTDFEVFNMDIPIFQMSNIEPNSFYGVTYANIYELYSLPLDSLVAFAHYSPSCYYQIITAGELIELITRFNIT
jgi:hypothetical protein